MNKTRKMMMGVVILCMVGGLAYLAIAWYYSKGFSVNTWINGVYCTGKTIEEVNSELLEKTKAPSVIIKDREGRSFSLTPEEIDLRQDYTAFLEEYLVSQNPLLWAGRIGNDTVTMMSPQYSYDEDKLQAFFDELPFVKEECEKEAQVDIVLTEQGYELKDTTRERLNTEKAFEVLQDELKSIVQGYTMEGTIEKPVSEAVIDLKEAGVYEDMPLTAKQEDILAQWKQVLAFQSLEIIYDMGDEQIKLDASMISQFLERGEEDSFRTKEDGSLYISKEKVDAFIDALADEYDTYKKERTFYSTRGDTITIKKGSYGTLIDREKEKKYLYTALTEGVSETHVPTYKQNAYHRGKNDIGDTYIEIDMTQQKMYLYVDGECLVDTDIVTGCTGKRMGTPEGIYSVYSMQRNRTLRGPGYASFVKYWMPVNGNIGIHDASWRKSFGGEIYKKSGSHGCINTPYEAMKEIYDNVEIGTPVVMFY